jgi:hypothetical protein
MPAQPVERDTNVDRTLCVNLAGKLSPPWWHAVRTGLRARLSVKTVAVLLAVAFPAAWFAMTLIYAGVEPTWQQLCNSDLLMPFMVMRDVLRNPASITHWDLSPAIYAFPDWILAGALQASPLPRKVLPIAYGGFLLATFAFCIGWILVEMRTARWVPALLWGTMLIATVFLASNATRIGFEGKFLKWICAPYIHSGSIFSGLLLIPLLSRVFHGEGRGQRRSAIAAAVLIALACYSDLSFAAWFAAPVCLAYLIMPTKMPFLPKAQAVAGFTVAGVAATSFDRWLRPSSNGISGLPWDIHKSIDVWQELLKNSIKEGQWQIWLPVILTCAMLGRAVVLTCTPRARRNARPDSIELAIIAADAASLFVPLLLGIVIDKSLVRYQLPLLILPYIWLLTFASRWITQRTQPWLSAAAVVFWLGCAALMPRGLAAIDRIRAQETVSKGLMSLGLKAGYGDYWTAKQTMFETNYAVHVMQLDSVGGRVKFGYNSTWFERRADNGEEVRPTFVVMTRLDEGVIRRLFGAPTSIKQVRGETIWLYDKPLPLITPSGSTNSTQTIVSKGDFVGIGTPTPDTTLHVARNHPDLIKLQNLSPGGSSWHLQVGGNGWQDGNFMIVNRPSGKHSLVIEPTGRVVVLGDMHVAGTLTTAQPQAPQPQAPQPQAPQPQAPQPNAPQPKDAPNAGVQAAMRERIDALTSMVEELLGRVGELEDAAVASP